MARIVVRVFVIVIVDALTGRVEFVWLKVQEVVVDCASQLY